MSDDDKPIPDRCLFFDEKGNGPSECRLIMRDVREQRIDGKVAVPRAFGLCWRTESPPFFVEDGGFMLTTDAATWLRDKLTAWLDAPRLEARRAPTVVASVELLRTAHNEWAAVEYPADHATAHADATLTWHTGPDAERNARADYANARGMAVCICGAEEEDEIDRSGDEPLCRKCVAEAQEAFKAQPMRCKDEPCGWTGTGADLIAAGSENGPHECPKCCGWTAYEADDATGGGQ